MKVLVVHCRRTGYGVIRSVMNKKYEVYGADTWKTPVSNSRYLNDFFVIPDMMKVSDEKMIESLISIAHKINYQDSKPVIFTGSDNYLLFFSRHYDQLKKYYEYSFESSYSILENALNKAKVNKIAQHIGVTAPKSYKMSEVEKIPVSEYPIIIKPVLKNTANINIVEKAFRIKICSQKEELISAADQLRVIKQEGIVQQYIPGNDDKLYTIGTYSYEGNLIAWSTCVKERQFPPKTGECALGKTTYIPELLEPAKALLKELSLTGISQIEFKQHKGKYYLIEINPRIWSWHQLHSEVGINFSQICLDYINGKISKGTFFEPLQKEVTWQFFWIDLLHNRLLNHNVSSFQIFKDLISCNQEAFYCRYDKNVFWHHTKRTIPYILNYYYRNIKS